MTQLDDKGSPALEAMVNAAIAFGKDHSYLSHPKVRDYYGTQNGDSPEKWERAYLTELCRAILAAASSGHEPHCRDDKHGEG